MDGPIHSIFVSSIWEKLRNLKPGLSTIRSLVPMVVPASTASQRRKSQTIRWRTPYRLGKELPQSPAVHFDGVIGDNASGRPGTDVDIYQFKLGVGERAIVDIDTATSGLDACCRFSTARYRADLRQCQRRRTRRSATTMLHQAKLLELDPYADFTATATGRVLRGR